MRGWTSRWTPFEGSERPGVEGVDVALHSYCGSCVSPTALLPVTVFRDSHYRPWVFVLFTDDESVGSRGRSIPDPGMSWVSGLVHTLLRFEGSGQKVSCDGTEGTSWDRHPSTR